ncbi:helix-turn-helix domain-containing protein [Cohnella fermenti]|uniref:Helix-turn-helix domain-containing protein n=1 Tax=Cohnella fermenti TaxID=2565925 RepID=A0A4S4C378_9BACL|nr:helix-turn-helix domain-containing protein [Cohnella fermenti]THF82188.1 helix-turn-helix domain-containing protein [Cohnella fermenti]
MPFQSRKEKLLLADDELQLLQRLSRARSEQYRRVERARILLHYANGLSIPRIADALGTTVAKVNRCVDKALASGVEAALQEAQRPGRPPSVTPEAKAWVVALACRQPKELGLAYEVWTRRLLAQYVRQHAVGEGHPCLSGMSASSVSRLFSAHR